jgi:hypothetical protein
MFLENKVVLYKPNPVNQTVTAPIYRKLFRVLIEKGYMEIIEGGIEVASAVIQHEAVSQVHSGTFPFKST